jgi:hypothetical protein
MWQATPTMNANPVRRAKARGLWLRYGHGKIALENLRDMEIATNSLVSEFVVVYFQRRFYG